MHMDDGDSSVDIDMTFINAVGLTHSQQSTSARPRRAGGKQKFRTKITAKKMHMYILARKALGVSRAVVKGCELLRAGSDVNVNVNTIENRGN